MRLVTARPSRACWRDTSNKKAINRQFKNPVDIIYRVFERMRRWFEWSVTCNSLTICLNMHCYKMNRTIRGTVSYCLRESMIKVSSLIDAGGYFHRLQCAKQIISRRNAVVDALDKMKIFRIVSVLNISGVIGHAFIKLNALIL